MALTRARSTSLGETRRASSFIFTNPGGCLGSGENVTQDLALRFPTSGDFTFASDLNILNAPNSYVEHAFARNSANELIHYWYVALCYPCNPGNHDEQGWGAENLTRKYPNCPECRIVGNLAVINGGDNNTTQHAFDTNANNELIQYWWHPSYGWNGENLTSRANIGRGFIITGNLAAINDRWVGNPNFATGQVGQNVFGRNANGELISAVPMACISHAIQAFWQAGKISRGLDHSNKAVTKVDIDVADCSLGEVIHYYWYPQPGWAAEGSRSPGIYTRSPTRIPRPCISIGVMPTMS
jgi:hypothetical protein